MGRVTGKNVVIITGYYFVGVVGKQYGRVLIKTLVIELNVQWERSNVVLDRV